MMYDRWRQSGSLEHPVVTTAPAGSSKHEVMCMHHVNLHGICPIQPPGRAATSQNHTPPKRTVETQGQLWHLNPHLSLEGATNI